MNAEKSLLIKKYPNRRLYDTKKSTYITLEELSNLIKENHEIKVIDVKTGADITKLSLMQVIIEQHDNNYETLPIEFLIYLIKLQDSEMSKIFSNYIKLSMEYFSNQYNYIQKISHQSSDNNLIKYWTDHFNLINQHNIDFMQMTLASVNIFNSNRNKK
jgi:polyhydroxyalkanoate synthesis repressor PhaR